MWQGSQPEQAQAVLEQTYQTHFEPFEAPLKAHGVDTLSIEYDFGRIGWRMRKAPRRRGTDAEELSSLVLLLRTDVDEAFSVLPVTASAQADGADL